MLYFLGRSKLVGRQDDGFDVQFPDLLFSLIFLTMCLRNARSPARTLAPDRLRRSCLRLFLRMCIRYEDKPQKFQAEDSSSGPPASSDGAGAGSELDDLAARFNNLRK